MKKKAKANGAVKRAHGTRKKTSGADVAVNACGQSPPGIDQSLTQSPTASDLKRPARAKLTTEEIKKRMRDFPSRREKFIASIRKNKD